MWWVISAALLVRAGISALSPHYWVQVAAEAVFVAAMMAAMLVVWPELRARWGSAVAGTICAAVIGTALFMFVGGVLL